MSQRPHFSIQESILSVLKGADMLLIVPPLTTASSAALGPHILQASAKAMGIAIEILYLDILFASIVGAGTIAKISDLSLAVPWSFLGERLFARSAYGLPALGKSPRTCMNEANALWGEPGTQTANVVREFDLEEFRKIESMCAFFVDEAVQSIASLEYPLVGATLRMGQTNCAVALLDGIKQRRPESITLAGGANCDGEMAEGIASLSVNIDYVFSGESETAFAHFLERFSDGERPSERIIPGTPLEDLNSLPLPDYENFVEQRKKFLGDDAYHSSEIIYETSRGCWWGEKHECAFCGQYKPFRQKKAAKALDELGHIHQSYPKLKVFMSDNIMPRSYHKELLPQLAQKTDRPPIFYMQKANLALQELLTFKKAGITHITTGIESLSSPVLSVMNKGVNARQNLLLLRNTSSLGLYMTWFLLWGFPGEKRRSYQEMLEFLPLLRHLQPPTGFSQVLFERASSYLKRPHQFGIDNLRPWAVYEMVYPEWADTEKLAYYFAGDYSAELREAPDLIRELTAEVTRWKQGWQKFHLQMTPFGEEYLIYDNRGLYPKSNTHLVKEDMAREIMRSVPYVENENLKWAVEEKLGIVVDSWYVPLVTAAPELLLAFEEKASALSPGDRSPGFMLKDAEAS